MVSLVYPKDGEDRYLSVKSALFGPFDLTNRFTGDTIQFDSYLQAMEEHRGIYHENDVVHDTIEGTFWYQPIMADAIPSPTAQYPKRIQWPYYSSSNPILKWRYEDLGLAFDGGTTMYYTTSTRKIIARRAYFRNPTTMLWSFYEAWAWVTNPTVVTNLYLYEQVGWPSPANYNICKWTFRLKDTGTGGYPCGYDLTAELTAEQIKAIWMNNIRPATGAANSDSIGYVLRHYKQSGGFSPSRVRDKIELLTASLFPGKFPVEEKPYGDLAMTASEKVNANKVNMLEFLKDLRHPTELIPKLGGLRSMRNLRKVKALSGAYLGVKYGIMPTIDDIKSIIAAFRKVGPYVDRNGFNTFSADHRSTKEIGKITYTLEQHLKLAIDEEDNEFEALIERLESMGTLPTFENLWDLVPYSFLVDWLVDVGGFLERVDTRLRLTRLNIRYVTMSRKTIAEGVSDAPTVQAPFIGKVKRVHYHRWVSDQCPVPPLLLESPIADFDHWLEAGALILQRAIK